MNFMHFPKKVKNRLCIIRNKLKIKSIKTFFKKVSGFSYVEFIEEFTGF